MAPFPFYEVRAEILGCFAETDSPEEQLHWVIENAKLIRSIHGVPILVTALKEAVRRYNHLLYVSSLTALMKGTLRTIRQGVDLAVVSYLGNHTMKGLKRLRICWVYCIS